MKSLPVLHLYLIKSLRSAIKTGNRLSGCLSLVVYFVGGELNRRCMNLFTLNLKRYGLALGSVLAAFAARFILEPTLGAVAPLVLSSLAVTVSAWYGGLGPGLVATLASGLLGDYFFIPPLYTFRLSTHNLAEQVELYLFYVIGIAISLMGQERLSSREKLQQL